MASPSSSDPLRHVPSPFIAVPFVLPDQVECACGHAAELHQLEDIVLAEPRVPDPEDPDLQSLYWRWRCPGYLMPRSGLYGTSASCPCTNIRSLTKLPDVPPEPASWELGG